MSERLKKIFSAQKPKTKFVAYFVGCHPTYEKSLDIIKASIDNGTSIVEIGYSTSEASAEGPIIKAAQDRVIANKSSLKDVINLAKEVRDYNKDVGIILMGYISNLFMFPIPNFIEEIKKVDVDGVLVVDAPHELKEENTLRENLKKNDIAFIKLVAPTTPNERLKKICEIGSGYIYCLNYSGTTGVKSANLPQVKKMVEKIKNHTNLPVCSGFGIKTPQNAKEIASTGVEGVIVGTTFVDYIEKNLDDTNLSKNLGIKIKEFTNKLN